MTRADTLLQSVFDEIGISDTATSAEKFNRIYDIVECLASKNQLEKVAVGTTGTITERICGWALDSVIPDSYYRLTGNQVKWLGDYALLGYPLNIIVSVKSFKAKERLLMSGTGSQLVPTLGFGLFDDPTEFKAKRLVSYRMRGFLSIYMPSICYDSLGTNEKEFLNWNGTPLVRKLENFPVDLTNALTQIRLGNDTSQFIDPLLI